MLRFIFKWLLWLKKKRTYHELMLENVFLSFYYDKELKQNADELLIKLQELRKDPMKSGSREAMQLQAEIVEIQQVKARLDKNHQIKKELEMYIETIEKS